MSETMILDHTDPGKFTLQMERQEDNYFNIIFRIDPIMVKRIKEEYYKAEKKFLKQRGFRNGKVPRRIMESKMGGESGAYSASFMTYANTKLFEHSPSKVLYTKDYDTKKNGSGWIVMFKAWLEPSVVVPDNIVNKEFEIPKLDVDEYVDYRIRAFAKTHPYLHNKESDTGELLSAVEGDMVEVNIQATIDGEEFKDGSHDSVNIRLIENAVHPPSLYKKLLGAVPGEQFTIETSNLEDLPRFKQDLKNKKNFKMEVSVIRVYSCEEPEIDDDLAITAGYDSFEKWKQYFKQSGEALTKGREEIRKKELLLEHLSDNIPMPDMPEEWARDKAVECVKANLVQHDSPAVRDSLNESAKHITILKAVGAKLNVEWEDEDQNLYNRDESAYSDRVLKHLLTKVKFTYRDPGPEDSLIRKIDRRNSVEREN